MMPLRASNINYNDLRHIIILGNERFISRWDIIWYPEIWLTLINARDLEMITLRTNNADIMVSTCTQPMTSIWQNLSKYLEMEISLSQDSNQSDVWQISPQLSDKRPSEVQYSHQGYIGEVWQQDSDKESFSSSWEQPLRPGWLVKKRRHSQKHLRYICFLKNSDKSSCHTLQGVEFAEKPAKDLSPRRKSDVQGRPQVKLHMLAFGMNPDMKRFKRSFCISGQSKSTSVEPVSFFQQRWGTAELWNDETHNWKFSCENWEREKMKK